MELREYLRVLKRRAWIPILLVIVTAATAGVLTYFSKPEYTATAQVSAKSQGTSASGQTAGFPEVADGNNVAKSVVEKLKLSMTPGELSNRIKVSSGKSDVYSITITDPDANQAVQLANAVAAAAALQYQIINSGLDVNGTPSLFDDQVQAAIQEYRQRFLDAESALVTFRRQHPNAAQ